MKYSNWFYSIVIASTLLFAACDSDSSSDDETSGEAAVFQTDEATGVQYKFYVKNDDARKANLDDIISMRAKYSTDNGKVLFNSRVGSPTGMLVMPLRPSTYKGDINSGLAMMHLGDSAVFLIPADSFFLKSMNGRPLPDSVAAGSFLSFEIVIENIQTLEEARAVETEKSGAALGQEQTLIQKYIAENNVTVAPTESGLYYIETKAGTGKQAKASDVVKVHYTGTLLDGTKFDSSVDRGEPFTFQLGMGSVIRGWDEGIAKMKVGGKAVLIIPSLLGYGERGAPGGTIGPYSPLKFEVELLGTEERK